MKNAMALVVLAGAATAAQAQVSISNVPGGNFVDISTRAGVNNLISTTSTSNFDDCSFSFTSSVTNPLFLNSQFNVQTNGFITFGATNGVAGNYSNSSIGATGSPLSTGAQALMPFWDDLIFYPNSTANPSQGRLQWIVDTAANLGLTNGATGNVLVIQWTRADLWNTANTQNAVFQVQIYANPIPSGPNYIAGQMLYNATTFNPTAGGAGYVNNDAGSATLGYVNGTNGMAGGNNVQWSYGTGVAANQVGPLTPAGTVLSIQYAPTPGAAGLMGLGMLAASRRRRA